MKKYFVSRQCYWPDQIWVVEIAIGGMDFANPNMLNPHFKEFGEGKEFSNPIEAVESAISIKKEWLKRYSKEPISIAFGSTGGFTMPFDSCTDEEAIEWADKEYSKLPKCYECGKVLGDTWWQDDFGDLKFCQESCCTNFEGSCESVI